MVSAKPRGRPRPRPAPNISVADIGLGLTSLFTVDDNHQPLLRALLHINGPDISFQPEPDGWYKGVFDILADTLDEKGKITDQINKTYTIRVKADIHRQILKEGFVYIINVAVKKPGAYQLRAAVRDTGYE